MPYKEPWKHRERRNELARARYRADPARFRSYSRKYMKARYDESAETFRERSRRWREEHPGYDAFICRQYKLKKRYNLTMEDFDALLAQQENKCGICGVEFGKKRACVDHCHETGRVRGLLCVGCNRSLGQLGDSLEGIEKVIQYLRGELVWQKPRTKARTRKMH